MSAVSGTTRMSNRSAQSEHPSSQSRSGSGGSAKPTFADKLAMFQNKSALESTSTGTQPTRPVRSGTHIGASRAKSPQPTRAARATDPSSPSSKYLHSPEPIRQPVAGSSSPIPHSPRQQNESTSPCNRQTPISPRSRPRPRMSNEIGSARLASPGQLRSSPSAPSMATNSIAKKNAPQKASSLRSKPSVADDDCSPSPPSRRKEIDRRTRRSASVSMTSENIRKRMSVPTSQSPLQITQSRQHKRFGSKANISFDTDEVFLEGLLKRQQGGGLMKAWKAKFCVVRFDRVSFYKDTENKGKPLNEIPLKDIISIQWDKNKDKKSDNVVSIMSLETKAHLLFESRSDVELWITTIEGVRRILHPPALDETTRTNILQAMNKDNFKGGIIKGKDYWEEEWMYRSSGSLKCSLGKGLEKISYQWDGRVLHSTKNSCSSSFGRSDGVSLEWYEEEGDSDPVLQYVYIHKVREYRTLDCSDSMTWKWTRHFLARKYGAGEWIVEGEVPEPVVMFVQIMRFLRCGHDD